MVGHVPASEGAHRMTTQINADNLTIGHADLYVAGARTAAPATIDTNPGAPWRHVGGTDEATTLTVARTFAEKKVQQSLLKVVKTVIGVEISVGTTLSETTLANVNLALGEIGQAFDTEAGDGTPGTTAIEVGTTGTGGQFALLIDATAPGGHRRRIYIPVCVQDGELTLAADADDYANLPVNFDVIAPGAGLAPLTITDKTADAS
jgi:hypothetical protein